ncbi:hypothetical protein MMKA1_06400 [Methanococcus maripaludis KA1]|jgi:hypothetical protein|uniref:Uncharacterized protein n=2 Tax=Methanococcus maripaludis TaxID=39152 RepID=A0A2Z5PQH6_METMI|nr:hypothetical protein [Methanococcus maripaludis]AEK19583.1 hypothetical protein GYY_03520 [Methanococcus maripaludis X1]BAP60757.1 hypothetical protein MMKA1_06400 [Methanococcus maripaludis KA1]
MKKIHYLFFLSLLLIQAINAAELAPDAVMVNDSVYLVFDWTAPENIENLSLTIDADEDIIFEEYEYNVSEVSANESVFKMFKGTATEIGNYKIKLLKRYFQNGTLIGSVEFFELSVVPDAGVRIVEKVVTPENYEPVEILETENDTKEEISNTSENTTVISLEDKDLNKSEITDKNTTSTEVVTETKNGLIGPGGIYYILGGLILGILLGAVIAYAKE